MPTETAKPEVRYPTLSIERPLYNRFRKHKERHGTNNQRLMEAMLKQFESFTVDKQAALIRGELKKS